MRWEPAVPPCTVAAAWVTCGSASRVFSISPNSMRVPPQFDLVSARPSSPGCRRGSSAPGHRSVHARPGVPVGVCHEPFGGQLHPGLRSRAPARARPDTVRPPPRWARVSAAREPSAHIPGSGRVLTGLPRRNSGGHCRWHRWCLVGRVAVEHPPTGRQAATTPRAASPVVITRDPPGPAGPIQRRRTVGVNTAR